MGFIDNRAKCWTNLRQAARRTLDQAAEETCQDAVKRVKVGTGTLRRSISVKAQQGRVEGLTEIRAKPDAFGKWEEVREPTGKFLRVPFNKVEERGEGFEIEFGAYAPYAKMVEMGGIMPAMRPRNDRTVIDGKERKNPHLRFDTKGGTKAEHFQKSTRAHRVKENPYLRPAVDTVKAGLGAMFEATLHDEMRAAGLLYHPEAHSAS